MPLSPETVEAKKEVTRLEAELRAAEDAASGKFIVTGYDIYASDAPVFPSLDDGINYYVRRGWRVFEQGADGARLDLFLARGHDPLAALDADVPDHIIYIVRDSAGARWPWG